MQTDKAIRSKTSTTRLPQRAARLERSAERAIDHASPSPKTRCTAKTTNAAMPSHSWIGMVVRAGKAARAYRTSAIASSASFLPTLFTRSPYLSHDQYQADHQHDRSKNPQVERRIGRLAIARTQGVPCVAFDGRTARFRTVHLVNAVWLRDVFKTVTFPTRAARRRARGFCRYRLRQADIFADCHADAKYRREDEGECRNYDYDFLDHDVSVLPRWPSRKARAFPDGLPFCEQAGIRGGDTLARRKGHISMRRFIQCAPLAAAAGT